MNKLIISSKTALVALLVMITTHASGFTRDDVTDKSKLTLISYIISRKATGMSSDHHQQSNQSSL